MIQYKLTAYAHKNVPPNEKLLKGLEIAAVQGVCVVVVGKLEKKGLGGSCRHKEQPGIKGGDV